LLATIPGIGERAAQVIISEIGVEMTRFLTAAHLASWGGFVSGQQRIRRKAPLGQNPQGQQAALRHPHPSASGPQGALAPTRQMYASGDHTVSAIAEIFSVVVRPSTAY
jgi:Transposase IS116/IS110/IS902 family